MIAGAIILEEIPDVEAVREDVFLLEPDRMTPSGIEAWDSERLLDTQRSFSW